MTAPARWPCHYCLRHARREPRSWALVALVVVVIVGMAVVALLNLGGAALL